MYKQVVLIRTDLKMGRGKIAAQAAHASLAAIEKSGKKNVGQWKKEGQKKVILKVSGVEHLMGIRKECERLKIPCAVVSDAGHTEVEPGTITALAIGPDQAEKIDKVTGRLKLL